MEQFSYKDAGVDIEMGAQAVLKMRAAVQSTYTDAVIGDIGGFGGLFSARQIRAMDDPVLVSATDGVGTKLALAKRIGRHSTVGIDLVAMCVNDLVVTGARPLFFLDYLAVGKLDADFAAEVVGGVAEGCRLAGCALIGGETAEHPGVMADDDYDLAGFALGVVERSDIREAARVQVGDQIIGLASSGLHSNGFSLVRRAWTDNLSDAELAGRRLSDGSLLTDALLAPTRIYVKALLGYGDFKAAAHITGGGITENLNRALPTGADALVKIGSWPVPEIIQLACEAARLEPDEAYQTFNMGIGMAVIVAADQLEPALRYFGGLGDGLGDGLGAAYHIGSVVAAADTLAAGRVIYQEGGSL